MFFTWLMGCPAAPRLEVAPEGRGTGGSLHELVTRDGARFPFTGVDCALLGDGAAPRPPVSCVEILPEVQIRATVVWRWDGQRYDTPLAPWLALVAPERGLPRPETGAPPCEVLEIADGCEVAAVPVDRLALSVRTPDGWAEGPEQLPRLRSAGPTERGLRTLGEGDTAWVELDDGGWVPLRCVRCPSGEPDVAP